MNRTDDRGYPYPEADCLDGCGPDLVRDAADLPAQLQALARAVDVDLTGIDTDVTADLFAPAADMVKTSSTAMIPGQAFTFDTQTSNGGLTASPGAGTITLDTTGLYVITGYALAVVTDADVATMYIRANGTQVARQSVKSVTGVGLSAHCNISVVRVQQAGDVLTLAASTGSSETWTAARFGVARIRRL